MFRNMVTSLLKHDRIKTTDVKAKELRRWADQIVTLAKRGDLHARRMAMSIVREKDVVHKLFEEAAERFGAINGGYTRIIKIGRRPGDAAAITLVELVSSDGVKPGKTKKTPVKAEARPADSAETAEASAAGVKTAQPAVGDAAPAAAAVQSASVDSDPDAAVDNGTEADPRASSIPDGAEK